MYGEVKHERLMSRFVYSKSAPNRTKIKVEHSYHLTCSELPSFNFLSPYPLARIKMLYMAHDL